MDTDDAYPILIERMEFLANAIRQGVVPPGGGLDTELTSISGQSFLVSITSARADTETVAILGQIEEKAGDGTVLEERASMDWPVDEDG